MFTVKMLLLLSCYCYCHVIVIVMLLLLLWQPLCNIPEWQRSNDVTNLASGIWPLPSAYWILDTAYKNKLKRKHNIFKEIPSDLKLISLTLPVSNQSKCPDILAWNSWNSGTAHQCVALPPFKKIFFIISEMIQISATFYFTRSQPRVNNYFPSLPYVTICHSVCLVSYIHPNS